MPTTINTGAKIYILEQMQHI